MLLTSKSLKELKAMSDDDLLAYFNDHAGYFAQNPNKSRYAIHLGPRGLFAASPEELRVKFFTEARQSAAMNRLLHYCPVYGETTFVKPDGLTIVRWAWHTSGGKLQVNLRYNPQTDSVDEKRTVCSRKQAEYKQARLKRMGWLNKTPGEN